MSLKSTIDQLNMSLEKASISENELRSEMQTLQRSLLEVTSSSQSGAEKLKQV
jgi:rootletin